MVTIPPDSGNRATATAPATLADALEQIVPRLENSDLCFGHGTDNPWDEAVQLALSVMHLPADAQRSVLAAPVSAAQWASMTALLARRINERIPLPYLLGRAWFAGLEFLCDSRALVPRSPLGELIGADYTPWWKGDDERRILDLCCGGGSIGIAAAHYAPHSLVTLADIDSAALALAKENIEFHRVPGRVQTCQSDLFNDLPQQRYDLILCNPPYVNGNDLAEMPAEYHAEPPRGLGAGDDGLAIALRVLLEAGPYLAPEGVLFLELGNSWSALDALLAELPLQWVEFENGGHGVLALAGSNLGEVQTRLRAHARDGSVRV